MSEFAIVEIAGKQYKVVAGQELIVDRLQIEKDSITFDKVLMLVVDGDTKIGTPYVAGVSVSAKVLAQEKGDKIYVVKFKAKSRYRRRTGFRAQQTRILIERIASTAPKTAKRPSK